MTTSNGRTCTIALAVPVVLVLQAAACTPPLKPEPHYVLGSSYQAGATWNYPRENFDFNDTGVASIIRDDSARLTADGEVFDQTALAGAHATLQLPAIARLTNLANGREVVVRLNDRGSADPHRLIEVTRRTAELLGFPPQGLARVRLHVLAEESHAAADDLPGAPSLAITVAPRGAVEVAELPPPPGVGARTNLLPHRVPASPAASSVGSAQTKLASPPMRLPEIVTQTLPNPGRLIVRLDIFDEYRYAVLQCAKMGWTRQHIVPVSDGRARRFRVDSGPLPNVAEADGLLNRALAAGIPDARIVVD